jgi:hypothetical protein
VTTPQGRVPGADTANAVSATLSAGQEGLVRLVDLVPGQRVQGTVVQVLADGQVMLGLLGSQVLAQTNLTLTPGLSYDFTVTAVDPQIVLTAAKSLVLPTANGMAQAGLLGPGGSQITAQLMDVLAQLPSPSPQEQQGRTTGDQVEAPARQILHQFLTRLATGSLEAGDLQQMQQRVGHDQEARVLRLHTAAAELSQQQQQQQEVAVLQQTLKAEMLRFLEGTKADAKEADVAAAARSFTGGLSRIEADNAHRAEQGAPQWLPLPVGENGFLKEARMFVFTGTEGDPQGEHSAEGKRTSFVVVLLLELTRLGPMRVDVEVRGDAVGVTFQAADRSTLHVVLGAKDELEQQLRDQGLQVRFVRVREAAGSDGALPVADLLTPPTGGSQDPTAMVDVHA